MKKLLNELIRKGRKPRWKQWKIEFSFMLWWWDSWVYELNFLWWEYPIKIPVKHSIRELVAKESWLWQFVCENDLVKPVVDIISICSYSHFTDDHDDGGWDETFPEYRIIESSLKDESELEDFLLSNIKADE